MRMVITRDMVITAANWRIALALAAMACALAAADVSAHAAYKSSSPSFAEQLDSSPSAVSLRFTQELFRREGANRVWLSATRDTDAGEVELGPVVIGNDDRRVMRATLDIELTPGRYLLRWINLSAEDGDTDVGAIPFYVAAAPTASEVEEDRALAQGLLIAYPGDEAGEEASAESALSAAPTVVRTDEREDVSLGAGPIAWLAAGAVAALLLAGALGFHLGQRRRRV